VTVENLIRYGEESLVPLFEFRNWLAEIRYNKSYRLKKRRNGSRGLGPFTLEARKEILNRLLEAQSRTTWDIITDEEIEYIRAEWLLDSQ
jgi:DNA sulfur modification protein DndC